MRSKNEQYLQIGMRVKSARKKARYTQEQLAELLNVSAQYISGIERGIVGLSIPILIKICELLQISCDKLLLGEDKSINSTVIVSKIRHLPVEHIKNVENLLDHYIEGIAITKRELRKE